MGMPWKDGKGGGYYVYLMWRGGARGFPFCGVGGNELAQQIGQALAARLDLPLAIESTAITAAPTPRQRALLRWRKWVLPVLLALTWLNSRFNLILWEDRWTDGAGNRYVRQSSLWHAETHAVSPDGELAAYVSDYTPWGSSGHGTHLRAGDPDDRRDYHGALRWGRAAVAEEQERQAAQEQTWQRNQSEVLTRRAQQRRRMMQPVEQARQSDPHNLSGSVSHAMVTVADALERQQAYSDANRLYREATYAGGSPAPRDLAAAHLGLGRGHKRDGLRLLARSEFERAAAVPGCPPDLADQARRELNALPR